MDPQRFLAQSLRLLRADVSPEGHRSAISRAYYAAFHAVIRFLDSLGVGVPEDANGHKEACYRLSNCADQSMASAGRDLDMLRGRRNNADYKMRDASVENARVAEALVEQARKVIETVVTCQDPQRVDQIKTAIKAWMVMAGRTSAS